MSSQGGESGDAHNRIFILGGKDMSQDEFKEKFSEYGDVKDVWRVEDRKTGEFKGVTYITFTKASEAALAIEELNGKLLGNSSKPLKVLLANDKREGNVRDPKEGEKMMRLFIVIPKSFTEDDLKEEFEKYGKVEYVRLIKDRKSGNSKGLAYIKYFRSYHAALALEQCDPSFKAVFAAPKTDQTLGSTAGDNKPRWDTTPEPYDSYYRGAAPRSAGSVSSFSDSYQRGSLLGGPNLALPVTPPSPLQELLKGYPTDGGLALEVMAAPGVTRDQLYGLLDMTPGLEYCELDRDSGVAYVQYKAAQCAAYAKEKLTYVEFPPGFRIAVRYPQNSFNRTAGGSSGIQEATSNLTNSLQSMEGGGVSENIGELVESIKKATDILQRAGVTSLGNSHPTGALGGGGGGGGAPHDEETVRFCNVPLPLTKPFASKDASAADRLFIVSQPDSFPQEYLQDALCRFGGLIDAFFMPGKNFGYAKFQSVESAEAAISKLHGQTVCGMRLKVMKADPPRSSSRDEDSRGDNKRARLS